jgi:hypothetical protein
VVTGVRGVTGVAGVAGGHLNFDRPALKAPRVTCGLRDGLDGRDGPDGRDDGLRDGRGNEVGHFRRRSG